MELQSIQMPVYNALSCKKDRIVKEFSSGNLCAGILERMRDKTYLKLSLIFLSARLDKQKTVHIPKNARETYRFALYRMYPLISAQKRKLRKLPILKTESNACAKIKHNFPRY